MKKFKRREFTKTSLSLTALTFLNPPNIIKSRTVLSQKIVGHGDFKYRVHQQWGDLDPAKTPVKNCHEMVQDSKGRLIMVGDHTKNNILIYDKSGRLNDSWGINYEGGHGLTLWDANGEEFLFICDTTGRLIKATPEGRELMQIGHPSKYGAYEEGAKFSPTESAIGPNGDIYLADGYGSQYVLQFTQKGEFIRKIGGGEGDDKNQFRTAHGVCIDDRDQNNPTLLVTSRAHNSFKRFTLEGKFIEEMRFPGAYVCRPVIDGEELYVGVCWSSAVKFDAKNNEKTHPYFINPNSGFVMILDKDNKVVSAPGGNEPKYVNGQLQPMLQASPMIKHGHDVCIDDDKNVYICQWNADNTYPVKLERV